jgi:hypothetical protein
VLPSGPSVTRRGLAIVVVAQFIALVAVSLLVGDNGWDDGAVTLAFARTFARHGRVALTPYSEVVEGFSSLSWFLLNALAALAGTTYRSSILISQILSALCICACTLLLARTSALLRLDRLVSSLTIVTFAVWGCSFSEASNGMEMGLLAAAILVIVNELLSPEPRMAWLRAGVALAVTTRFEAGLYVGLLALGVAAVPRRRAFWGIVVSCLATVSLLSAWRLTAFSDILPNPFWAKRWPPYAAFGLAGRLTGALEMPRFFLAPLIALPILYCLHRPHRPHRLGFDVVGALRARGRAFSILAAPLAGAVVMGALTGEHWGYRGRMPYFAFPPALLALALLFSSWVEARGGKLPVASAAGLFVLCAGTSMTGFPSGSLSAAFAGGAFGVTPHTYAESGRLFRRFASVAEVEHPAILTADLGGLALSWPELRAVDLGMLSNRTLAHAGPSALGDVLAKESPHMVEAHEMWAASGRLYESPLFQARYQAAFGGGTRLWLRRDLVEAIESKGRGCWLAVDRPDVRAVLGAHRYRDHQWPEDGRAFEKAGVVFAMPQADPTTAKLCDAR